MLITQRKLIIAPATKRFGKWLTMGDKRRFGKRKGRKKSGKREKWQGKSEGKGQNFFRGKHAFNPIFPKVISSQKEAETTFSLK
jgi:hypothetical protein